MQRATKILFVAILVLVSVWGVASLWWPYGGDQAWLGWIADTILAGGRPYVNAWDNNTPGGPLLQAAVQAVFGHAEWPLRALDLIFLGVTCWALMVLGRRLASREAGLWAALAFACWYGAKGSWHTAERDGWGAMFVVWAMALATTNTGLRSRLFSGGLVGLAVLMKPLLVVFLLPLTVAYLEEEQEPRVGVFLRRSVPVLAGFAVPVAAVALWLAPGGGLVEAYRCVVLFNLCVYAHIPTKDTGTVFAGITYPLLRTPCLVILALAGSVALLGAQGRRRWSVAAIWPLAAWIIVVAQPNRLIYHWHVFYAPLALLWGVGLARLGAEAEALRHEARPTLQALLLAVAVLALASPARAMAQTVRWWGGQLAEAYASGGHRRGDASVRGEQSAAEYVRARTAPGEPIQVWRWFPGIYFMAERPSATRFGYDIPLSETAARLPELHRAYVAEFLRGLEASKPRYFLVDENRFDALRKTPGVLEYLTTHYAVETKVWRLWVYRRLGAVPPGVGPAVPPGRAKPPS
jgi:4-amino-4-deoxy-L-arabinose transferase-like glycosyltransferase